MALYEIDGSHVRSTNGLLSRIGCRIRNAIRVVQYARMMQALSELSDAQLEAAGIERSDIPHRAHYCIYGTDA